jgi:uncharacterized protein (TIGR00369 family)
MEELLKINDIQQVISVLFSERIPYNKLLGLRIGSLDPAQPTVEIDMRDDLVGNFIHKTLHGGVTAAVLDVTGGLVAFLNLMEKLDELSREEKVARFAKLGTIDLRIDYLRPGRGNHFVATGYILRTGNKVAVTRMELHNEQDTLIAVGTGAYTVS